MKYRQVLQLQLVMLLRLVGIGNAFRSSCRFKNHNFQQASHIIGNSRVSILSTSARVCHFNSNYKAKTTLYSTSSNIDKQTTGQSTISSIMDGLNPSQVEAVAKPMSAITRVLAGPGSGKTKVLTCRIAYLLEHDRNRILAVTFTRKAANEMKERVEKLLSQQQQQQQRPPSNDDDMIYPPSNQDEYYGGQIVEESESTIPKGLERVTLGTFHSVCAKILRYNGNQLAGLPSVIDDMAGQDLPINLDGSFAILDQGDQLRILKECLDEAEIDLKKSGIKPLVILNAIGQIKESFSQGIDPFQTKDNRKPVPKRMRLAKDVYGLYRAKLFTNNAVDFDDLIFLTRELLTEDKELRQRLHKRWAHVLVDEFQDTSRSQMDLVKLLTSGSLFVVGDADQSIYSWRGAHVGSMSDFTTEFRNYCDNGVDSVYLKENYRSTSNIVRAAEKVISMDGNSAKSDAELRRSMKPKRGSGPSPRVVACKDERAEANFVVDNILEMLMEGELQSHHTAAIIYRTNAQSRYLEEACVQKNLPYVIRGGAGGFYKRAEVKDCLCFLRWLYNGNDEGSMLRAVKTPSRGIGEVGMTEFREYYDEVTSYHREHFPEKKGLTQLDVLISMTDGESDLPNVLENGAPDASVFISKRALNKFLPFSRQMRDIRNKANSLSVDALLFYIISELDLVSHFDTISKSKSEFEERRQNVQELRNAAKRYSNYGPALTMQQQQANQNDIDEFENESALGNFLDDVALVTDITDNKDGESSTGESRFVVNLMTIHGSKGTEYDSVFVVGNEEGTLPSNLALQEGEGSVALEEEKRLCYVAMTRAKTRLVMTWRKEVTSFSNWSDDGPRTSTKDRSRFLDALVSKKGGTDKKSGGGGGKRRVVKDTTDNILRQKRQSFSTSTTSRRRPSFSDRSFLSRGVKGNQDDDYLPSNNKKSVRKTSSSSSSSLRSSLSQEPTRHKDAGIISKKQKATAVRKQPLEQSSKQRKRPYLSQGIEKDTSTGHIAPKRPVSSSSSSRPFLSHGMEDNDNHQEVVFANSKKKMVTAGRQQQSKQTVVPSSKKKEQYTASSPSPSKRRVSTTATKPTTAKMDSTWFYPVGSMVIHETFGKGKVLKPPSPGNSEGELPVLVQFQDGTQKQFCAKGTDIVPDLGL